MVASFSNREAACEMTAFLVGRDIGVSRSSACRCGTMIAPSNGDPGYLAALEAARPAGRSQIVCSSRCRACARRRRLIELMKVRPKIEAVFLTGDVLATGAVLEANRRGWRVPDTLAIAGSDDDELQECVLPALTSLRFPRYEIGCTAASMLLNRIGGDRPPAHIVDLGFQIIPRQST